jgi:hypothetical protein
MPSEHSVATIKGADDTNGSGGGPEMLATDGLLLDHNDDDADGKISTETTATKNIRVKDDFILPMLASSCLLCFLFG